MVMIHVTNTLHVASRGYWLSTSNVSRRARRPFLADELTCALRLRQAIGQAAEDKCDRGQDLLVI